MSIFAVYKEDAIEVTKECLESALRQELYLCYGNDKKAAEERIQRISKAVIEQLENNSIDDEDLKEIIENK